MSHARRLAFNQQQRDPVTQIPCNYIAVVNFIGGPSVILLETSLYFAGALILLQRVLYFLQSV